MRMAGWSGQSPGVTAHVGDDVTVNVRTIKSIPVIITASEAPSSFTIRGEIYLPRKGFEEMNADRHGKR